MPCKKVKGKVKKFVKAAGIVLACCAFVGAAVFAPLAIHAADSFTVTAVGSPDDIVTSWDRTNAKVKVIKAAWKANGVDGTKTPGTLPAIKGRIVLGVTNPGATAPTDNYDVEILDAEGADVFGGALLNRDQTNSEQGAPKFGTDYFMPRPVYGPLTFSLSGNSVNDALGEVFIYYIE